ncbi:dihydroorotate dehydrogenase electron transfer subunit [Clostridium tetanomorphum]|uniref:Dihydroorotate dehydrogenase B (NAD(+)), electron transfer subunit n=1 Tax=Clostridium tetanomorphum TaxID=1553 RepID=A0A923ED28_CLOTT|nr:dihydroorotate dehydrogenase electron transfer subunit [Clostridium tetanomorphum]KAJ51331.1 dihydroorotate dehydrogenase electron transfer subunit [Clostridium tetanomorphum DSM 665]MBC2399832.1 dihydroorotate dehydrogenase electron transfer subunit [Clostridium tetanomorphum]MBP1865996.1 dihydroorotate dehydrogenase electron transfer subunit [Clostridium tetanomorphum]NRS85950.1 dihydroorotate dehydrogenase electron transfer subunit [Clostridium tetanomorphum]NRZ96040.1 dihydroorotate deh
MEYRIEYVKDNKKVCQGIYKLSIEGKFEGKPGQFYMLRAWDKEPLLSRPISIHSIEGNTIEFLYAVVGEGTKILSSLKKGDSIKLTGPLGNYFPVNNIKGKVALISGGIGIAPMYEVAKNLKNCQIDFYCGFRDEVYSVNEFEPFVNKINTSTESGAKGYKGYVTDILKPENYDIVLCCGPEVMMKKVINMCKEKNVPSYVSMEKHMACGVGACLVCTCKTKSGNKRTCKDGPVFLGEELEE